MHYVVLFSLFVPYLIPKLTKFLFNGEPIAVLGFISSLIIGQCRDPSLVIGQCIDVSSLVICQCRDVPSLVIGQCIDVSSLVIGQCRDVPSLVIGQCRDVSSLVIGRVYSRNQFELPGEEFRRSISGVGINDARRIALIAQSSTFKPFPLVTTLLIRRVARPSGTSSSSSSVSDIRRRLRTWTKFTHD